jgi:hypothetical protein
MAPRAAKLMQPARGQVRIGILQDHEISTLHLHYSLKLLEGKALSAPFALGVQQFKATESS